MYFYPLRDREKIEKAQKSAARLYQSRVPEGGRLVSSNMPALPNPFELLCKIIDESPHRQSFLETSYYFKSNHGTIEKVIPASEYYKTILFWSIPDKKYSLILSARRAMEAIERVTAAYNRVAATTDGTKQRSVWLDDETYILKADISNVLIQASSILDSFATLTHFLYGPSSNQFTSFDQFAKDVNKGGSEGECKDPEMARFIDSMKAWYEPLKDLRDYCAHFSSLRFHLYETPDSRLLICLEDGSEALSFLLSVMKGVDEFLAFCNQHYAAVVQEVDEPA